MVPRCLLLVCSIISMAAVAGCSDPYAGRMEVTGGVKLQGKPLKDGSIVFEPLDKQGTQSGAAIANGEYKVPRQSGLKPGKYLVRLTAGDGKTPANEEAASPGGSTNIVSMDLIPDDWNTRSKHQVEVTSSGPNRFDFEIPNVNTRKRK
jgi:hypothetical protein